MIDWDSFKQQLQTNPNRTLGFVLGLAGCLMLIWLAVVVQTSDPTANRDVAQSGDSRLAGLRSSLQQGPADTLAGADSLQAVPDSLVSDTTSAIDSTATPGPALAGEEVAASNMPPPSTGGESGLGSLEGVMPTLLVMVALVGGLWYWVRRKTSPTKTGEEAKDDFYTVLGRGDLFPGQQIALLRVGHEYLLVGGGPQGPQLLRRYTREEWEEQSGTLTGTQDAVASANGAKDWKALLGRAMERASSGGISFGGIESQEKNGNGIKGDRDGEEPADNDFHWDPKTANGEAGKLW